jgi:hypothetical protein
LRNSVAVKYPKAYCKGKSESLHWEAENVNSVVKDEPLLGDTANIPGKGGALTTTMIVADDFNPPAPDPVEVRVKARVDPGEKVLALIINSTVLRPIGKVCVTGDRDVLANVTDVSFTVQTDVPAVCNVTKPDTSNLFAGLNLCSPPGLMIFTSGSSAG